MSPSPVISCPDDLVPWLQKLFVAGAASGLHAVVHFDVRDDPTRSVVARIEDGRLDASPGMAADPDVRLVASHADFLSALRGLENVDVMHMQGRVDVEGDLGIAMKLRCLFPAGG